MSEQLNDYDSIPEPQEQTVAGRLAVAATLAAGLAYGIYCVTIAFMNAFADAS